MIIIRSTAARFLAFKYARADKLRPSIDQVRDLWRVRVGFGIECCECVAAASAAITQPMIFEHLIEIDRIGKVDDYSVACCKGIGRLDRTPIASSAVGFAVEKTTKPAEPRGYGLKPAEWPDRCQPALDLHGLPEQTVRRSSTVLAIGPT